MLKLVEHLKAVGRKLVLKVNGKRLCNGINLGDRSDITVINACAAYAAFGLPYGVIIVFGLNDPVADTEHRFAEKLFLLALARRIERRLQALIEVHGAGLALSRR